MASRGRSDGGHAVSEGSEPRIGGAVIDDATVEILLRMRQTGLDAARDVAAALGDVRTAMLGVMATNFANNMAQALAPITALWQGMQNLGSATLGNLPIIGNLLTSLGGIPVVGIPAAAALLAIAVAVVSLAGTILLALAGAVTILAAVALGFTAIGVAALVALGPLGLMAGAVLMLADRMFTTGQTAVDPLLKLEKAAGAMADTWGKQATPIALQLTDAMIKMLPAVTSAGQQMLEWFGLQLPRILPIASDLTRRMSDEFNRAWPFIAGVLDQLISRGPQIGPAFSQAMNFALDAAKGLFENLMRFVDWFTKEWPKLQPIASQVLSEVGRLIQWLAQEGARLVNWFVANWPEIARVMKDLQPVLQFVAFLIDPVLGQAFITMMKITELAISVLGRIGRAFSDLGSQIQDAIRKIDTFKAGVSGLPGIGGLIGAAIPNLSYEQGVGNLGLPGGGRTGGTYQAGGMVPGTGPQLVMAHGGEMILNPDQLGAIISLLASIDRKLSTGFSTRAYASRA